LDDPWQRQREALGQFIRAQRRLAKLTLRQMADLADVSNPYLSQIERGLHAPSVKVLKSIATALNISAETLLAQAGLLDPTQGREGDEGEEGSEGEGTAGAGGEAKGGPAVTEAAIRLDPALTEAQKEALLAVYRSYLATNRGGSGS
jgi:transcriptional regulator with XRE-family HTH domain